MGLTSSLYSGVSGLTNMGTAMQVIGDNISNVNTMGFKAGRASFQDIMAQSVNTARSGSQVGRGSAMADVEQIFQQGSFESTSSPTDLAIAGTGFFILSNPNKENSIYYTRAGQFSIDQYGYLVNPAGYRVQGWEMEVQPNGQAEIVGAIGDIQISNSSAPVATTQVTVAANLDSRINDPVSNNSLVKDWIANNGVLTANVHYEYSTSLNVFDSLGNTHELTTYFDRTNTEREWEFLITMNPTDDRSGLTGADKGLLMRGFIRFTPQGQIDAIYDKLVTKVDIDGDGVLDTIDAGYEFTFEQLEDISATNTLDIQVGGATYTLTAYDPATNTVQVQGLDLDGDGVDDYVSFDTTETDIKRYTVHVVGFDRNGDGDVTDAGEPVAGADLNGDGDFSDAFESGPFEIENLYNLPTDGLPIDSDGDGAADYTIVGYDHENKTVDIDTDGDGVADETGVSISTEGRWTSVTYGEHNYPELKAYFLPPSGEIDQISGYDTSAQVIEFNFGAKPETVTRNEDGTYTVSSNWETEAITTTQYANRSSTLFYDQNGFGAGFLESLSVDDQGIISGSYSNGRIVALAQVGLARFNSPKDLSRAGGNLWQETTKSGAPITGQPRTNGLGSIASNALEQSTVDIGTEFVKLITTQRAFQANSRLITTTDDMLNELLNMKR